VTRPLGITEATFETSVATSIDDGCRIMRRWLETAAGESAPDGH
jgi:hypothetical protein